MIKIPEINLHLGDCMDLMREKPDGHYDLAVLRGALNDPGQVVHRVWVKSCVWLFDKHDAFSFTASAHQEREQAKVGAHAG